MTPRSIFAPDGVNDGSRPDLLTLGRRAVGELDGPVPADYARALDAARSRVPAFDPVALRARAHRLDPASAPDPRPATAPPRHRRWWWSLPALAAAALALVVLRQPPPAERAKGTFPARLDWFVLQDGEVRAGEPGLPVAPGDRVQFTYVAGGRDTLVLLDIDGEGRLSLLWPESEDEPPVPVDPAGAHVLEGSVRLDDAAGPEVFVALFGFDDTADAVDLALDAWEDGGVEALEDLADADPAIDVIVVDKSLGAP